ncbi:MAG: alpha/beta fold hydrolase [Myxococcota bacterium]
MSPPTAAEHVASHRSAGRFVDVRGQRLFVREEGEGPPVLLLHGVPSSSFLYRKMMAPLAQAGVRAVAFDFPGMGLSAKPRDIAYDWHALAGWLDEVVETLGLGPVHLVVHDIGGPIGFEWALDHPSKVASLTVLNTLLDLARFSPPFPMWLYRVPGLRQVVFRTQSTALFVPIMRRQGVARRDSITPAEVGAYLELLRRDGGRRSFLAIMAGFDLSPAHGERLAAGLRALGETLPMQLIWGRRERAIPEHQVAFLRRTLPFRATHEVEGAHFLQEDVPEELAELIAGFARSGGAG